MRAPCNRACQQTQRQVIHEVAEDGNQCARAQRGSEDRTLTNKLLKFLCFSETLPARIPAQQMCQRTRYRYWYGVLEWFPLVKILMSIR
jgi:hypothetical protein